MKKYRCVCVWRPCAVMHINTHSYAEYGPSHLIRHPSKSPFKNRFFGMCTYVVAFPQSGSHTIIDCECPALRIRAVLKGCLKEVLEGCLIKWLGPIFHYHNLASSPFFVKIWKYPKLFWLEQPDFSITFFKCSFFGPRLKFLGFLNHPLIQNSLYTLYAKRTERTNLLAASKIPPPP